MSGACRLFAARGQCVNGNAFRSPKNSRTVHASSALRYVFIRIQASLDAHCVAAFETVTQNSDVPSSACFNPDSPRPTHPLSSRIFTSPTLTGPRGAILTRSAPDASPEADPEKPTEGWWTKDVPDNVVRVTSVQELVDQLEDAAAKDQLVVFECFAPWCGSCKALFHKLKKICKEHDDVKFVLLNFEDNRRLAKGLGIKVLPFFHFYRGADGKVEELTASISKIDRVKDAIVRHKSPRCALPSNSIRPYIREYPDVQPSARSGVAGKLETAGMM